MKNIINLRKKLGLSQRQLAVYLGIPKSTLSMYEKAHRSLPLAALKKLALLEIQLAELSKNEKPIMPAAPGNNLLILELEQLSFCYRKKLVSINKRLHKMEKAYIDSSTVLPVYSSLIAEMPADNNTQKLLLEIIAEEKKRVLAKMNPATSLLLQFQAKHLQLLCDLTGYNIQQIRKGEE